MKEHMKRCHDVTVFPIRFKDSKQDFHCKTANMPSDVFVIFFPVCFALIPPLKF